MREPGYEASIKHAIQNLMFKDSYNKKKHTQEKKGLNQFWHYTAEFLFVSKNIN